MKAESRATLARTLAASGLVAAAAGFTAAHAQGISGRHSQKSFASFLQKRRGLVLS
jgi:hypothetical protein